MHKRDIAVCRISFDMYLSYFFSADCIEMFEVCKIRARLGRVTYGWSLGRLAAAAAASLRGSVEVLDSERLENR